MTRPTTETHPVAVPTEPGLYEAFEFPLDEKDGDGEFLFVPIRLVAEGEAFEEERDGSERYPVDVFEYADLHGPFRRVEEPLS